MNASEIRRLIFELTNCPLYKQLEAFYSQQSVMCTLGVSRLEDAHSNFLAWLLNPTPERSKHELGEHPLRKFLGTLALVCDNLAHGKKDGKPKIDEKLLNHLMINDYGLSEIHVRREVPIASKAVETSVGDNKKDKNRIDIVIEADMHIDEDVLSIRVVVENKVKSSEGKNQTLRYHQAYAEDKERCTIFVYLTPLNNHEYENLDEVQCLHKDFIQLNYQYLLDHVIEPCQNLVPEYSYTRN